MLLNYLYHLKRLMLGIVILKFQRNDAKPTTIKFYVNPHAQGLESQRGRDKPTLMVLQPWFDLARMCKEPEGYRRFLGFLILLL